LELWTSSIVGLLLVRGATLQSATTGSVYNLKYEHERRLDFCLRMSLVFLGNTASEFGAVLRGGTCPAAFITAMFFAAEVLCP